jgi:hypothetical protein
MVLLLRKEMLSAELVRERIKQDMQGLYIAEMDRCSAPDLGEDASQHHSLLYEPMGKRFRRRSFFLMRKPPPSHLRHEKSAQCGRRKE